ncbi:hypothetical protein LUZ60_016364 [Juncus effusus]|nr:hypothetical protein LUZ60_016364 [Juncus effusus]
MNNNGHGKKRERSHSNSFFFPLGCGCKDAKSVSVSRSTTETTTDKSSVTPRRAMNNSLETLTLTLPSVSTSSCWETIDDVDKSESSVSTPISFSGLLHELKELEKNVNELGNERKTSSQPSNPLSPHVQGRAINGGRLERSIAVIKETEDPFGDFKKSMLQMIVENEIVSREEMQELLHRFLLLNSPENHDFIVRAFMDIWNQVLIGEEDKKITKLPLRRGRNCNRHYCASKKI